MRARLCRKLTKKCTNIPTRISNFASRNIGPIASAVRPTADDGTEDHRIERIVFDSRAGTRGGHTTKDLDDDSEHYDRSRT